MVLYISNRGNLTGSNLALENNPQYIQLAMKKGYHVIVDVKLKYSNNQFQIYLGELAPQYLVNIEFLKFPKIIARVDDLATFQYLKDLDVHVVYNTKDITLSTKGLIWTAQGCRNIVRESILNMPEFFTKDVKIYANINCMGICSNKIETIMEEIKKIRDIVDIDMTKSRNRVPLDVIEEEEEKMLV